MDLHQLRCFLATAEELHFGRAAQRLGILPSSLSRQVRLLEEDLGTSLLARTTRNVGLTREGTVLLEEARDLLAKADDLAARMRRSARSKSAFIRVGAIDSAAAGLIPSLLCDFRKLRPDVVVQLVEDKTARLLPRLLSGRLDLAFVRPPDNPEKRLETLFLFHETVMVAVPITHRAARRRRLSIEDLVDEPLIIPARRSRPHSHDLTVKAFTDAGLRAHVGQVADEKQTIVNLVAAGLGVAIVPRWTSRMAPRGVRFIPLRTPAGSQSMLPLAAMWIRGARDETRDQMIALIEGKVGEYSGLV
ncbi:MAG TPA: LysR family transcriptional regulator [Steroidobacteraceae bacterium]|nr:LysR family transcriptional regulator [Steroidobacteraceae bacterium]